MAPLPSRVVLASGERCPHGRARLGLSALLMAALMGAVTPPQVSANRRTTPEQVHLSLSQEGESRAIIVFWLTEEPTATSTVRFGLQPEGLWRTTVSRAQQERYTMRRYKSGYVHEVTLRDLSINQTTYFYQVGDPEGGWSDVFSFNMHASHPDADVRLFAFGDQDQRRQSRQVTDAVVQRNFGFHYFVHLGDITYADGRNPELWDRYGKNMEPLVANLPTVYALGNHENERKRKDDSYHAYLYRWRHGERNEKTDGGWFSVSMGPIHLVVLSSEHTGENKWSPCRGCGEKQVRFLDQDLEEAAKPENRLLRPWIIVAVHRPMYQTRRTGLHRPFTDNLEKVMEKHRVNIVMEGHCHDYERTYPVHDREVVNHSNGSLSEPYIMPVFEEKRTTQGQIHLVVGTGGAKSDGPCPTLDWHVLENIWKHGYGLLEANRERLHFRFVNKAGETLDEFKICSVEGCGRAPVVIQSENQQFGYLNPPPPQPSMPPSPPPSFPPPPQPAAPPGNSSDAIPPTKPEIGAPKLKRSRNQSAGSNSTGISENFATESNAAGQARDAQASLLSIEDDAQGLSDQTKLMLAIIIACSVVVLQLLFLVLLIHCYCVQKNTHGAVQQRWKHGLSGGRRSKSHGGKMASIAEERVGPEDTVPLPQEAANGKEPQEEEVEQVPQEVEQDACRRSAPSEGSSLSSPESYPLEAEADTLLEASELLENEEADGDVFAYAAEGSEGAKRVSGLGDAGWAMPVALSSLLGGEAAAPEGPPATPQKPEKPAEEAQTPKQRQRLVRASRSDLTGTSFESAAGQEANSHQGAGAGK